ncbi:M28 family peptidase [Clostridium luticellarii]|jgi:Zn-dependent M28 family amino/carboxypeptidase|uniref:Aminopeptidase YwaD n=2 Tax=Clostridium luticellarii TaxID=1691940 RepID=A0A2T0BN38_9CLOT|nr:M28 family peptidase [Clostridium luticellarii]MCI1945680.1 M20/M25/M40 family metallo-hydrolase [Clostridium luticellarii]MCI1967436.1 M20/M25/M40 family metallo-hydrolase [Clostridium luticellarii]PRR85300.1 Aminopeptidase YwaD precursor [Clostridium luticellarii]
MKSKIQSYGYEIQIQVFSVPILTENDTEKLGISQNLIAVKKGKSSYNKGTIVICAHYDSTKDSIGANDNASGVSVVMETARLLKDVSSDYELRFIFFGSEEAGNIGSHNYIDGLSPDDKKNIKAVLNIDSIAQEGASKPYIFTMNGKKNFAIMLLKNIPKNMNVKKAGREISDYAVFYEAGIPSLCIGQAYDKNLKINGPRDTISAISGSKLKLIADIIINSLDS